MKASLRLCAITFPCLLLLTPSGSAQVAQLTGNRLAQLAEVAWQEGEAKPLPVATAEAFGYGTERLSYRVLTVKTSEADRHEVLVIALADGTHALHLARRLPNDIWMIRTSLSGEYSRGVHRTYPKGPLIEMDAPEGQQVLDREAAFWLEWLGRYSSHGHGV